MVGWRSIARRTLSLAVALTFAVSATLFAATVPASIGPDLDRTIAAAEADAGHGGCHGMSDDGGAPAHPTRTKSCCDIACHAWMPPPTLVLLQHPPAATEDEAPVASMKTRTAAGIDRPPRTV